MSVLSLIGVGLIILGIIGTIVTYLTKSEGTWGSQWAKLVGWGVFFIFFGMVITIF